MKDGEYEPIYDDQGREVFPLNVTFLAMIYLYDELIVTGGDDGYVSTFNFHEETLIHFRHNSFQFRKITLLLALRMEKFQDHQEEKCPFKFDHSLHVRL